MAHPSYPGGVCRFNTASEVILMFVQETQPRYRLMIVKQSIGRQNSAAQTAASQVIITSHNIKLLVAVSTLLLAATLGQTVIAAEHKVTVSTEAAAPTTAAAGQKVKGPDPEWRPPTAPRVTFKSPVDPEQAKVLAKEWGVKLINLNVSAAGYMLDFRFHVLDAEKALPLFDHRIKPYVIVERSNAKLPVPMAAKVGAFRTTNRGKNIKADKTYYMLFGNPDSHVKPGEKVTVVIGDFRAEHLVVN